MSLLDAFYIMLAVIFGLYFMSSCWLVVSEQTYVTTTLFGGRFYKTYKSGLHLKMPWPIESRDLTISTKVQQVSIHVSSLTSDGAQMTLRVNAQISPSGDKLYEAAYTLNNPMAQIQSFLESMLRSEINGNTVTGILKSKNEMAEKIKSELSHEFEKYGYDLKALLFDEPQLSDDMKSAFERKLIADRSLEAANAEGEVEKRIKLKRAEAEGETLITKTKAWVTARKLMGEGNAEALNAFVSGIHDGSVLAKDALSFFAGFDKRDTIRDAASHGAKVVFVEGADTNMNQMVAAVQAGTDNGPESVAKRPNVKKPDTTKPTA